MNEKLLLVEDDAKTVRLLTQYLAQFGYDIRSAREPEHALRLLGQFKPDLIILDLMLPQMDGLELCRLVRRTSETPIIMLTARGDVNDKIVGLEMGADDYMPKPFEPRELLARIRTILRRTRKRVTNSVIRSGDLIIDVNAQSVLSDAGDLDLTTREFELLLYFVRNRGRVLTRESLMDEVRGVDWDAFNRSVDVLISRLRQKLGDDPRNSRYIKTVWGSGYKFIADDEA